MSTPVHAALYGLATGDALGVPVEFRSRDALRRLPVTGITGYGTHNQPPGTWSDDSSLAFCLADALLQEFNLQTIGNTFVNWYYHNLWTPHGTVFDIGNTTLMAIRNLSTGCRPDLAGGMDASENGNGSLMRIMPLLFYIKDKPVAQRYELVKQVSALTHAHIRSVIACFYYLEFAGQLLEGKDKFEIYTNLQTLVSSHLQTLSVVTHEKEHFKRLLSSGIFTLDEAAIKSSGYVVHTLEAAIWCLLTTNSYAEAVLKAVNLGSDTDTTGAVTGALAGLLYGYSGIPAEWTAQLARRNDIENLCNALAARYPV
jgi:ADP-ribosyl-[dinitrogen reductase] hydrolase